MRARDRARTLVHRSGLMAVHTVLQERMANVTPGAFLPIASRFMFATMTQEELEEDEDRRTFISEMTPLL